jgi:hypothetical protein
VNWARRQEDTGKKKTKVRVFPRCDDEVKCIAERAGQRGGGGMSRGTAEGGEKCERECGAIQGRQREEEMAGKR